MGTGKSSSDFRSSIDNSPCLKNGPSVSDRLWREVTTLGCFGVETDFCLRPLAKDQGITQVVVVLVLFHLPHFLFKRNKSEINFP